MYSFTENTHTTVIGRTQSGKTWAVNRILKNQRRGVLFFNTQLEDLPGYILVDKKTKFIQMRELLKKGYKLSYNPSTKLEVQAQEISFLIEQLFENGNFNKINNIFIVIDEVHLFQKEGLAEVCRIATGGVKFGLNGIFLSQRPAQISNVLMTQSSAMVIFFVNMESQYFKSYEIPIEPILHEISVNGQWSFCSYDFNKIESFKSVK
jgi:DNA helicase HerA-like ATPase